MTNQLGSLLKQRRNSRQQLHHYIDQLLDEAVMERNDFPLAEERRRVLIGFDDDDMPIYKKLRAGSQDEMNDRIVQEYISSGRIKEFYAIPVEEKLPETAPLLKDYAIDWLKRKRKLKETTRANYQKYLREYILPVLGEKKLTAITVADVQEMMDRFAHLSHKTLKDAKGVLSQIMKYAMSDELIKRNPCDSVDLEIPSDKKKVRNALPIDQYKEIISGMQDLQLQDRRFLALCMFTAMRRGEVLGLRWEDIDGDILHVRRNVTHPQQNTPQITTPKTEAGVRDIPIIGPLAKVLSPAEKEGFIIGGNQPLSLSAYRAMWTRINKTIDMHGATPHVLRHSYLTYAVGETTDFKTVQGISGHADLNTLLNIYSHPQQQKVTELANRISKILT